MTQASQASASSRRAVVTLVTVPGIARDDDRLLLSAAEQTRADRFAVEPARTAFITARATLRRLLGQELGRDAADVQVAIGEHGRPYLADPSEYPLDFNLSHSGSMVAIVIARGRRVGIDVEWHGNDRGLHDLIPTVMSVRETAFLATQRGVDFTRAFLDCWTRKEALLKAHGVGLGFPLQQIDVPVLAAGHMERVALDGGSRWSVTTLTQQRDYSLSVAIGGVAMCAGEEAELDMDVVVQTGDVTRHMHDSK